MEAGVIPALCRNGKARKQFLSRPTKPWRSGVLNLEQEND